MAPEETRPMAKTHPHLQALTSPHTTPDKRARDMTLREHYAGQILQAILIDDDRPESKLTYYSVKLADALVRELRKHQD